MEGSQNENKIRGKIIICTYPKPETDDYTVRLELAGAKVLYMPAIEIRSVPFTLPQALSNYQWLVFTSKNGIRFFAEKFAPTSANKIAVIGESSSRELEKLNLQADYIGSGFTGADFAKELNTVIAPKESVLLVLGELAPDTIRKSLKATNPIDRVNVYQTVAPEHFNLECVQLIESNQYDLMIVSSPSAIKNLYLAFHAGTTNWRVISIGQTTTSACRNLNIEPLATAQESTYKGLVEATIKYLQH